MLHQINLWIRHDKEKGSGSASFAARREDAERQTTLRGLAPRAVPEPQSCCAGSAVMRGTGTCSSGSSAWRSDVRDLLAGSSSLLARRSYDPPIRRGTSHPDGRGSSSLLARRSYDLGNSRRGAGRARRLIELVGPTVVRPGIAIGCFWDDDHCPTAPSCGICGRGKRIWPMTCHPVRRRKPSGDRRCGAPPADVHTRAAEVVDAAASAGCVRRQGARWVENRHDRHTEPRGVAGSSSMPGATGQPQVDI